MFHCYLGEILSWFNLVLNQILALRWSSFILSLVPFFPLPSLFLSLSGMPPSLLTQSLLAFEVKVVHMGLMIVQWAWLNYGLQMSLSHWRVNGHHTGCGWWAGLLVGHWWQTCWSLTLGKHSQMGTICGPGCGSYEALWCWEQMRSQVEAGWGLEANLICLSCFWDPWTSLSLVICCLSPSSKLEVW